MNRNTLTLTCLLMLLGACADLPEQTPANTTAGCPPVSAPLNQQIAAEANKVRAAEYCRFREHLVDGPLELVIYTLESPCHDYTRAAAGSCGNHFYRALTGICNGKLLAPITVGERGTFIARTMRLEGDSLIISGSGYRPSDPLCCPTGSAEKRYRITADGFAAIGP